MNTSSQTFTATNGATVVIGTITAPDGSEHSAHGGIIDLASGHVSAYAGKDGELTLWNGDVIGRWHTTSTYRRWAFYGPYTMRCIRATIKGDARSWYGRFNDEWELVNLRPSK